jgi:hypothetical protein
MVQFVESQYRFTDPIRYFKANDPIYYEVDNIPLKQLQENDLWIKDQLAKLEFTQVYNITSNIYTSTITNNTNNAPGTITRDNFDELKPYVNGTDNVVRVRPGRFSARINSTFRDLPKLQYMAKASFPYSTTQDPLKYEEIFLTLSHPLLYSVYDKVKNAVAADALAMNGLAERVFTRMVNDNTRISNFALGTVNQTPRYTLPNGEDGPYPNVTGRQPVYDANQLKAVVSTWFNPDNNVGNSYRAGEESEWIKNWRGVARTAIVDVPQELEIEIPAFNLDDFYYINEANNRVRINGATQRVDLVFIWAKPIDASAATILSFPDNGDVPKKIYKAELGIVKGAGVGLNFNIVPNTSNDPKADVPLQDEDGNAMIIPSIGDEFNTSLGFSGLNIRGSFPSPDDLMNISPTLLEPYFNDSELALSIFNTNNLEDNQELLNSQSLYYIGQSILPVAYVVVKNNAQLNANQVQIITPSNLVDIRPFFRTTELSYNERAGLAAATPQVSLANPVASENFVLNVARDIYTRLGVPAATGTGGGTTIITTPASVIPRPVACGYILGGVGIGGTEKAIIDYMKLRDVDLTNDAAINKLRTELGYPQQAIKAYPGWDYANWRNTYQQTTGTPIYQYLNFIRRVNTVDSAIPNFLNAAMYNGTTYLPIGSGNNLIPARLSQTTIPFAMYFVKKRIKVLKNANAQWVNDFQVQAKFFNCMPVAEEGAGITTTKEIVNGELFINIIVYWTVPQSMFRNPRYWQAISGANNPSKPDGQGNAAQLNNNNVLIPNSGSTNFQNLIFQSQLNTYHNVFANFVVVDAKHIANFEGANRNQGYSNYGVAIYPSIQFTITGFPQGYGQEIPWGDQDQIYLG